MKIVTMNIKTKMTTFFAVEVSALSFRLPLVFPTIEKAKNAPVIGSSRLEIIAETN